MEKGSGYSPRGALCGTVALLICLLSCISSECLGFRDNPAPTVTVIDDETGRPIEGAVALAVWRKHSSTARAWWEGGTDVVVRIEEAVSDSRGNIFIRGFWNWHLFENNEPQLTIYKFGYVCWDQGNVYIDEFHAPERTDFDKDHRTARMRKWPKGFSFVGHETFVNGVTRNAYTETSGQLFNKAYNSESPYIIKERSAKRDQQRKETK